MLLQLVLGKRFRIEKRFAWAFVGKKSLPAKSDDGVQYFYHVVAAPNEKLDAVKNLLGIQAPTAGREFVMRVGVLEKYKVKPVICINIRAPWGFGVCYLPEIVAPAIFGRLLNIFPTGAVRAWNLKISYVNSLLPASTNFSSSPSGRQTMKKRDCGRNLPGLYSPWASVIFKSSFCRGNNWTISGVIFPFKPWIAALGFYYIRKIF